MHLKDKGDGHATGGRERLRGFNPELLHYLKYVGAALLTATVTWVIDFRRVQRDRVSRCVELSKDFTSSGFLSIRNRASALLFQVYRSGLSDIEKNHADDYSALTALAGFYQHVGISFAENTVKRRLVIKYSGSNFVWWYINIFSIPEGPIAKGWGSGPPVKQLYADLKKRAPKKDWTLWHHIAEDEKLARTAAVKGPPPVPVPVLAPTSPAVAAQ